MALFAPAMTFDPAVAEHAGAARRFLTTYLRNYAGEHHEHLEARYRFHFTKFHYYWSEDTYTFEVLPIFGKIVDEPRYPADDVMAKEFQSTRRVVKYKPPKHDVIDEIPIDKSLGYRGMSYEEWAKIHRTGVIASSGRYNMGDLQRGLTFFGTEPSQARSYANSFTPWLYKPAATRPGVIIAVPQRDWDGYRWLHDHTSTDVPPHSIPETELAAKEPIPIRLVAGVWFLLPTNIYPGETDIVHDKHRDIVSQGSGSGISIDVALVKAKIKLRMWQG